MDAITAADHEYAISRAVHALRHHAGDVPNGRKARSFGAESCEAGEPSNFQRSTPGFDSGTGAENGRPGAFARDYGPQRATPDMEPKRLSPNSGRDSSSDSGSVRQGSLVRRAAIRFRAGMNSMCPGTRVFYWCLMAASLIEIARVI